MSFEKLIFVSDADIKVNKALPCVFVLEAHPHIIQTINKKSSSVLIKAQSFLNISKN